MPAATVEQASVARILADHKKRIRILEAQPRGGGVVVGVWITIGTPGLDGVDSLIAANPAPYNADPWIPFEDGWTNSLGTNESPVQFKLTPDNWVRIRGVAIGGTNGSTVFTLPMGYRPVYDQPLPVRSKTPGKIAAITIQTDGSVLYEQEF